MSKTLSIYACSGIGTAKDPGEKVVYDYWLDNTSTVSNTQAVNTLLSRINLIAAEVGVLDMTTAQILDNLQMLDLYCTMLYYAQAYQDDAARLHDAGLAIGKAWGSGLYVIDSLDNGVRDSHLDEVISVVGEYMNTDLKDDDPAIDQSILGIWVDAVENRNKVGFSVEIQNKITKVLDSSSISGIGAADYSINKDLASYLDRAGEYFLYTYFSDEDLKVLPTKFKKKRDIQRKVYADCKQMYVNVFGSEADMRNVIRAGIIKDLGYTPEVCVENIVAGYKGLKENKGVGDITAFIAVMEVIAEVVTAIASVLSVVAAIVKSICSAVSEIGVAKYAAVDVKVAEGATPAGEDYSAFDGLNTTNKEESKSNMGLLLLAAVAAVMLIKKN